MTGASTWRSGIAAGLIAGSLSLAAMVVRGRLDAGALPAALNAPSHWIWGDRALGQQGWSMRYTGMGILIHQASSVFWSCLHEARSPSPDHLIREAALTTAAAAFVDLALTPRRFTPGFERRLTPAGLAWVYAFFAIGLAIAGSAKRRSGPQGTGPRFRA